MRVLLGGAGEDWVLDEAPVPQPATGQVQVRVRAAAANRADLLMLEGSYNPGGAIVATYTAGLEFAGEVSSLGDGVTGVEVGDRVMGAMLGAFADHMVLDHRLLIPVPDGLSWTDAAGLPVGLTTEHDALVTQSDFVAGQSVLVTGGTSGVGMVGIQMAKALGASQVLATTTSATKADALRAVGADVVIDTSAESLTEAVLAATGGAGVDVVLDHVGGGLFGQLPAATKVQGTIINIGRLAGPAGSIDLDQLCYRRLRVLGTTFSIRTDEERGQVAAALAADVLPAVTDGRIRPIVDEVIPFADATRAADLLRTNAVTGKVVLDLTEGDHQ